MSKSDDADRKGNGRLEVQAPGDVEVVISNGLSSEVARGFGGITKDLSAGIYSVRWISGGNVLQELVRVFPGDGNPVKEYKDEKLSTEARELAQTLSVVAKPRANKLGVLLYIPWKDERPSDSFTRTFRLTAHSPTTDDYRDFVPTVLKRPGALAVLFHVPPGSYVLRYNSVDRIIVQQSVHVYAARVTVGLISLAKAARLEGLGDKAQFRARDGVEPSATRILSVPANGSAFHLEAQIRLVGTLLQRLSAGGDRIEPKLWVAIEDNPDPYIRTYAASLLLGSLSDASHEAQPKLPDATVSQVMQLIKHPSMQGAQPRSPDAQCAWWRLSMSGFAADRTRFNEMLLPPMLERSWQWATAWSLSNSDNGVVPAEIVAASLGRLPTKPWLTWRANVTRNAGLDLSRLRTLDNDIAADARDVASAFSDTVEDLRKEINRVADVYKSTKSFSLPSVDITQLSNATKRLAANVTVFNSESQGNKRSLLEDLVKTMKAPISVVASEVQRALDEVKVAASATDSNALMSQDPWKDQFGGSPERNGYRLVLRSWKQSNDPDFLALDVAVLTEDERLVQRRGKVRFFLHPTFNPITQDAVWQDGVAAFTCYAFGAFTLGALVDDGTKLELDLATDVRLPQLFRSR